MTGRKRGGVALVRILATAFIVLTLSGPGTPALPASGQESPAQAEAVMTLVAQTSEVAANGQFQVLLDIKGAPANSDVAVDIYKPITAAVDLLASSSDNLADSQATFEPIPLSDQPTQQQTTGFTILLYAPGTRSPTGSASNWPYSLDEAGVYPIKVRLRDADDALLTSFVTYLVRQPSPTDADSTPVTRAKVALVTAVHQPPAIGPDAAKEPLNTTFTKALSRVLAQFEAQPRLPATFAITPETASRLGSDPGSSDTLTALTEELAREDRELLDAPFVKVDPASLVGNGLAAELTRQAQLGRRVLDDVLDEPRRDIWVIDHPVDPTTVEALGAVGVSHLVLPTSAVSGGQPTLPLTLPGAAGGIDAVTMGVFGLATGPTTDPVLSAHQLFGQMAASASLNPAGSAITLAIDPETVDPVQLETLFSGLAKAGSFLQASTVSSLFDDLPAASTTANLATPKRSQLGAYPELVRNTHGLLASYSSMLIDGTEDIQAFERPLAVTASTDLALPTRRGLLRAEQARLGATLAGISTPPRDRVTLGARDARFPLPITSTLGQPVKVVISLEASDRLSFPNDTIEATLTSERTMVEIPVRTRATGDTPLNITVRTPDGRLLTQSRYRVRSTAVSGMGVLLTIGAGGFLALWWGRNWARTRRQGRHGVVTGRRSSES